MMSRKTYTYEYPLQSNLNFPNFDYQPHNMQHEKKNIRLIPRNWKIFCLIVDIKSARQLTVNPALKDLKRR